MMSFEDPGSITRWIDGLKAGQPEATDAIWRRYYRRVVGLARRRLQGAPHQAVEDDEDVALSAMNGLYVGAAQGRFAALSDRRGLWSVLSNITGNKARLRQQWYSRLKRGGDRVIVGEVPANDARDAGQDASGVLARFVSREPPPDSVAIFHELLEVLGDPGLRQIAECLAEGMSIVEIAEKLGCVVRTVERRMERIRVIWEEIGVAPDQEPAVSGYRK
jgi:ECF sigma factor